MKTTKIVKLQINPETEAERAAIVTALELAVAAHEGDPDFTATVRELEGALPDLRGAVWAAVDFSPFLRRASSSAPSLRATSPVILLSGSASGSSLQSACTSSPISSRARAAGGVA